MSDEASVKFSTGADGGRTVAERTYSTVFVGDLQAHTALARLTPVDKETFADVLAKARPTAAIAIKPPLGDGADWEFSLTFDQLKRFDPAGLLQQIPQGRARLELRTAVSARRGGRGSPVELQSAIDKAVAADPSLGWARTALAAPPPGAAPAAAIAPGGASVLDLVDEPDPSRKIEADVERLAAAAGDATSRLSGGETGALDAFIRRLDLELGKIADAVLHHPDVRALELAWRGVKFLVDRIDFRAGNRLALLSAPRDEAVARFAEQVVQAVFNGDVPTPGLVLFDYSVQNTPLDLAMLDELGQQAQSLPVPVAFPVEAGFFNVKSATLIKNLPNLSGLFDTWQFAKYRTLREQPHAKALAPVLGRFLLRPPHEPRSDSEFAYKETAAAISDLLWAGGHLAVGMCAARSFASHGWPTRMFGSEAGRIEDLAIVPNPNDPQRPWGPGDLSLPDARLDEVPEIGFNLLQSMRDKDYCILLGGVAAAKPVITQDVGKHQAILEVSLPYQQFSNILSTWLTDTLPTLKGASEQDVQMRLLGGLQALLGLSTEEASNLIAVGTGRAPDDPSRMIVQVSLTPPNKVAPGGLHVDFAFLV